MSLTPRFAWLSFAVAAVVVACAEESGDAVGRGGAVVSAGAGGAASGGSGGAGSAGAFGGGGTTAGSAGAGGQLPGVAGFAGGATAGSAGAGFAGSATAGSAGHAGAPGGAAGQAGAAANGSVGGAGGAASGPKCSGDPFPQGVPDPDGFIASAASYDDTDPAVDAAVNAAMSKLTGCSPGSDCPITGFPGGSVEDICQAWFGAVTAELRAQGFCAGQHVVGSTDEIAVANTSCDGEWYGYHVCFYGGPKVVWNPGARRGWWKIASQYCP
ncbi:MAG: hypothetical protein IT374_02895 [Polyangiaceae bacterium]|nr:hypothetical protein [Polyangiaceae bacterium]